MPGQQILLRRSCGCLRRAQPFQVRPLGQRKSIVFLMKNVVDIQFWREYYLFYSLFGGKILCLQSKKRLKNVLNAKMLNALQTARS